MTAPTPQETVSSSATLSRALDRLKDTESHQLPDVVLPLREVTWAPSGLLLVPGTGEARPTGWALDQLSSLLGVRWDRWFATTTPEERSDEINRRLRRANNKVRLRLAQDSDHVSLRALVSTSYSPIQDSAILEALGSAISGIPTRLHRLDQTERMTSIAVCVGEPQSVGGIVGKVWGMVTVTNSGVGWSGLGVSLALLRLVCSNGMKAPLFEADIVRARHRSLQLDVVREQLQCGLLDLAGRLSQAGSILQSSQHLPVDNVEAEVRALLRERGMIRNHHAAVMAAYGREPRRSVFGISQALTLHAQQVEPEERVALEDLAGSYVARAVL